jgi:hypothetical protein
MTIVAISPFTDNHPRVPSWDPQPSWLLTLFLCLPLPQLYINNYAPDGIGDMCYAVSWYLAVSQHPLFARGVSMQHQVNAVPALADIRCGCAVLVCSTSQPLRQP